MPSLKLDNGTLHYEVAGSGTPVLMIQGVGMNGSGWRPQVEGLCERHEVAIFDNCGVGRSLPMQGELTIERMAADARALMDHLGWKTAHVVGHSMGGVIAQQLALDVPDRVRSLSLLCTLARGKDALRMTKDIVWLGIRTRVGTRAMRRNAFLDLIMTPAYLATVDRVKYAAEVAEIFGRDLADNPPIAMKQLQALGRHDAFDRLPALRSLPTLVVTGAQDKIARVDTGRALASQTGARFVLMEDGGHALTIHKAAEVNRLLLEHLAAAEKASVSVA